MAPGAGARELVARAPPLSRHWKTISLCSIEALCLLASFSEGNTGSPLSARSMASRLVAIAAREACRHRLANSIHLQRRLEEHGGREGGREGRSWNFDHAGKQRSEERASGTLKGLDRGSRHLHVAFRALAAGNAFQGHSIDWREGRAHGTGDLRLCKS